MFLRLLALFVLQLLFYCVMLAYAENWDQQIFSNSPNNEFLSFGNVFPNIEQMIHDQTISPSNKEGSEHSKGHAKDNEKHGFKRTGGSKKHHIERGKKFDSGKENRKKDWGTKKGVKTHHNDGKHHQVEHHKDAKHYLGDVFKDAHKYNKGNYEKGFREKYHLDETKKHRHFWRNADSHKKWKKLGGHESEHDHKNSGKTASKTHKESSSDAKDGKDDNKEKTILSTHSHGHKKEEGQEISYAHEKKFHQR